MNNKRIAEIVLKVQMDDLADAQMLAEYAHEVSMLGDNALAQSMAQRSKMRLSQMSECERAVGTVMQRIEAEGTESAESVYKELLEKHLEYSAEKVHRMLEEL